MRWRWRKNFNRGIRALHNSLDFSLQEEFSSRWMAAIWRTQLPFIRFHRVAFVLSSVIRDYRPRKEEIERRGRRRKMCERKTGNSNWFRDTWIIEIGRNQICRWMNGKWKLKIENIKGFLRLANGLRINLIDR